MILQVVWKSVKSNLLLHIGGKNYVMVEWFTKWPYHNFAHGQQNVSNIANTISEKLFYIHIFFLLLTGCELKFFMNEHSIKSFHDLQGASDISHFVKGSLITAFPMNNSLWVALYSVCVKGRLITYFHVTNRKWVTSHFGKGSHIWSFQLTACE